MESKRITTETAEERRERLEREDYLRRAEISNAERRAILESNGLRYEDHTPEVAPTNQQCCG